MTLRIYIFTIVLLTLFSLPVMAENSDHVGCDETGNMANVSRMGLVNEATLQKHIVKRHAAPSAESI